MSHTRVRGTERVSGEVTVTRRAEEAHEEQGSEVGGDSGLQRRRGGPVSAKVQRVS